MLKNKGRPVDNISMNAFKKKMKGKGDNARQNTADNKSKKGNQSKEGGGVIEKNKIKIES